MRLLALLIDHPALREVFDQWSRACGEVLRHCCAREVFVVLLQGR